METESSHEVKIRPIDFREGSREEISRFPEQIRKDCGGALALVQQGEKPPDVKPLPSVAAGAQEIRLWGKDGTYRVIYIPDLNGTVVVLCGFKKVTKKTPKRIIKLAKKRYKKAKKK